MTQRVEVLPSEFSSDIKQIINRKLMQSAMVAQGQQQQDHLSHNVQSRLCSGRYGYQIAVASVDHISEGEVPSSSLAAGGGGSAFYSVRYKAILYKPFRGEVVDCQVTMVNKMGFYARAGPLQIFVSSHLLPGDLTFQESAGGGGVANGGGDQSVFTNADQTERIERGEWVRVRIVGTSLDATEIFAIGSIKEDYLGVLHQSLATLDDQDVPML